MRWLLRALLLLQSLALTTASTVWQHTFPFDQVPRSIHQQQPPPPATSKYNETTAMYLAHVTSVSYCQQQHIIHWNCQPCSLVPSLEGLTVVMDAKDNFQGLVGYSQLYDAVVIAFRGSMDVTNWLDNLTFLKRRAYAQFPGVLVHQGFYWAYRSVAPQVLTTLQALRKQHPHASLMVSGHSLGGAVAAICAFELEYIEKIPVHSLYTFGKPRVGNTNFSGRLRNASMEVYRVTHFQDAVPHLPPTWTGFEHTSEEIFYDEFSASYRNCSQTDGEDPTCSNTCSPFSCTSIVDHLTFNRTTFLRNSMPCHSWKVVSAVARICYFDHAARKVSAQVATTCLHRYLPPKTHTLPVSIKLNRGSQATITPIMSMRKAPGLRLQTSIVQDNIPVEISAGLFIGSIHAAFNVETLKFNRISHILNLAGSYATFPEDFTYLSLSIRDKEYASLLSCLPIAAVFIDAGLRNGGVLIHCAGGRSRSPAVAMAFLMMKQQISYAAISAHVKTLRPVVSLNTGFDAQLKCLETAHGDVFIANQHLLKARLVHLTQQHKDGELTEVAKKRRQPHQMSSTSPPPPLLRKLSSIEMLASGCDDRGMVGERVPSGFCLSLPPESGSCNTAPRKTPDPSFIPALRSMGTMFGCQSCGENLFCAGAIVHHHDIAKLTCLADNPPGDGDYTRFLGTLRGHTVIDSTCDVASGVQMGEEQVIVTNSTKKPLLAKLRLRPHSPSVTMRNGSLATSYADASSNRRKSSSPVLSKPSLYYESSLKSEEEYGSGLPQPLQILQPTRRPATEDGKRSNSTTLSPIKVNGESKKKPGSGLWRSLTAFKSSKRTTKAAAEDKRTQGQLQYRSGISDLHKLSVLSSSLTEDGKSSEVGQTSAHLIFLERNAMEWHRNIQQLVDINKNQASGVSTVDQVAALLVEDSTVLVALNGCKQWFVDPQLWAIEQARARPEGEIRCPRESCKAVVGEWRWEGLSYECGGCVTPAFVMKKDAVCVLGNMTAQSTELMATASGESHPEE